mgnify:CR=1 FL=1
MKITKQQLKKLIEEELSNLEELDDPGTAPVSLESLAERVKKLEAQVFPAGPSKMPEPMPEMPDDPMPNPWGS